MWTFIVSYLPFLWSMRLFSLQLIWYPSLNCSLFLEILHTLFVWHSWQMTSSPHNARVARRKPNPWIWSDLINCQLNLNTFRRLLAFSGRLQPIRLVVPCSSRHHHVSFVDLQSQSFQFPIIGANTTAKALTVDSALESLCMNNFI